MSDSTQVVNTTATDDFEDNRAKTKKALPAFELRPVCWTLLIRIQP